MTFLGWAQIALFCLLVVALARPLGGYMTRLFAGERTFLSPVLGPVERGFYRVAGVDAAREQHWVTYGLAMLRSTRWACCCSTGCMRLQHVLPLNPQGLPAVEPAPRLQHRGQLRHQHQLAVLRRREHDGLPRPDGRADGAELRLRRHRHRPGGGAGARLHARRAPATIGNFWADLVRGTLYVLLPLSIVLALFLVWQGVPQNLDAYVARHHARGRPADDRAGPGRLAGGDQDAGHQRRRLLQRQLGPPVREPDAAHQLRRRCVSIFAIGAGLTNLFGRMAGDERQGWAILAAMGVLFLAGVAVAYWAESRRQPAR